MGILDKLLGGARSKLTGKLKQAQKLLDSGKLEETTALLREIREGDIEPTPEEAALMTEVETELFTAYLKAEQTEPAIELALKLREQEPKVAGKVAQQLVEQGIDDPRIFELVADVAEEEREYRPLLKKLGGRLINTHGNELPPAELKLVTRAAKAFPLWKEGQGLLADLYLAEDRRDDEALAIYRQAYLNRKADVRLRQVILESLIHNETRDEEAAEIYKDAVDAGTNTTDALRLLATYYLEQKQFTPATMPYIERALEVVALPREGLQKLADWALNNRVDFADTGTILQRVYQKGYKDRDVLIFLGKWMAENNKFDDEAIEIMSEAFRLKMVDKRVVLLLTEHCLANDREDEFAVQVYETYLSTWPDRPQRRIYEILAHHYADMTRVDLQAQKIYAEALVDNPTDPQIITMLARAYHAADRRDEAAEEIYRHAFPIADPETKQQLATLMSELRVEAGDYSEETLQYLTVMGKPTSGPLKDSYNLALTNCFLAAGRRGEQAQQAYFELFERTKDSDDLNPRLVSLLAEIIKERGQVPATDSLEMDVYRKLFELQKFSTDAEISFVLLRDELEHGGKHVNRLHVAVRAFESGLEELVETLKDFGCEKMLKDIGDFYIEHYNFEQAAQAYSTSYELEQTDEVSYKLAKIYLLNGDPDAALRHLEGLESPEYKSRRDYWVMAAYQQQGKAREAAEILEQLRGSGEIDAYLLKLREAINHQIRDEHEASLEIYDELIGDKDHPEFMRWLQLERGIVLMILERLDDAEKHLEQIHRQNPSGRAEQLFLSIALFLKADSLIQEGHFREALPLFKRAVEINRSDRTLRQVIVELLAVYGEQAFFGNRLNDAALILEESHRILSKRIETKIYLAYTYHRLKDYGKALIYYRDITWSDDNPRLERSQAYCYMENNQPRKAWRVFLDLARRGNMLKENFPRMVKCFLQDEESTGGKFWEPVEFDAGTDPLLLSAVLIHDGLYQRATKHLEKLLKQENNPQYRWYLGRAYSSLDKRDLAVHNWKELAKLVKDSTVSPEMKQRQFSEITLAFLDAGYANEALETCQMLEAVDSENPDLPVLRAAAHNLMAYQLARRDHKKEAREQWKLALKLDTGSAPIVQNYAIISLLLDNYDEATKYFTQLARIWQGLMRRNPQQYAHFSRWIEHLDKALNQLSLTKGRAEFDLTKVRAEDIIHWYQQANEFYWFLSLDKNATPQQIETAYFRLIKIYNPERHADDFMLVEEAYSNLYQNPERREIINLFVFNPINVDGIRSRLAKVPRDGSVSFEKLDLPSTIPPPDFAQLEPTQQQREEIVKPLMKYLSINFKIPDWMKL
jgi:tetratricopeptide (TPR) repeat protein